MAYQASITAFTHVHYVNGVLITHSHFSSDTPDCCELQHPMRSLLQVMESETDTPVIKGKACRMPSLRAPPYSVTL